MNRELTTVEELEALPAQSVVLDADEFAYQSHGDGWWDSSGRSWWTTQVSLPVTLLYTPEATS